MRARTGWPVLIAVSNNCLFLGGSCCWLVAVVVLLADDEIGSELWPLTSL